MRITMICIGSTGDVRPYLVLGRELRRRGHEVSICAFANFASAVKAEGLGFKPVSGDVKTFMANLMNGANGVAFLKQVRDTLREFIEPFLADLEGAPHSPKNWNRESRSRRNRCAMAAMTMGEAVASSDMLVASVVCPA